NPRLYLSALRPSHPRIISFTHHAIQKRKLFLNDDSVRRVIYLVIESASKKWSMLIQYGKQAFSHFIIAFGNGPNGHI
ncbi:hypothetical protein ACJ5XU_004062, partial [Providencia stuartii]